MRLNILDRNKVMDQSLDTIVDHFINLNDEGKLILPEDW